MLIISAASAIAAQQAASEQAEAQADNISEGLKLQNAEDTRLQQQQWREAAAAMNSQNRQALKDTALFDTVAGEFGGGKSVDRAGAVASIQNKEQLSTIANNARQGMAETAFQASASARRANSQINSIQKPSTLGTALTIGSAAVGAYTNYQKTQTPKSVK